MPKTGGRRKKEGGGARKCGSGSNSYVLAAGRKGSGRTRRPVAAGVSRLGKSPGKPRKPGKPLSNRRFTRFPRFTRRFHGAENDSGSPGVRRKISGCERDRAGNSTGVLTRDSESFAADSRGSRGTVMVSLEPQTNSPETESAGFCAECTEVLAGKAENAKRREKHLSAFPGNSKAALVRCRSESSPRGTLLVTILSLLKSTSPYNRDTCGFSVPLGSFRVGTVTNTKRGVIGERGAVRVACPGR